MWVPWSFQPQSLFLLAWVYLDFSLLLNHFWWTVNLPVFLVNFIGILFISKLKLPEACNWVLRDVRPRVITVTIQRAPRTPEHSLMSLCSQLPPPSNPSRVIVSQRPRDRTLQCIDSLARQCFGDSSMSCVHLDLFGFCIYVLIQNSQKKMHLLLSIHVLFLTLLP